MAARAIPRSAVSRAGGDGARALARGTGASPARLGRGHCHEPGGGLPSPPPARGWRGAQPRPRPQNPAPSLLWLSPLVSAPSPAPGPAGPRLDRSALRRGSRPPGGTRSTRWGLIHRIIPTRGAGQRTTMTPSPPGTRDPPTPRRDARIPAETALSGRGVSSKSHISADNLARRLRIEATYSSDFFQQTVTSSQVAPFATSAPGQPPRSRPASRRARSRAARPEATNLRRWPARPPS